jgi:predicted peptidase
MLIGGLLIAALAVPGMASRAAEPLQQEQAFEKEIVSRVRMKYLLYLPPGYDAGANDKQWPLLMFLHGSGETGTDVKKLKGYGVPRLIAEKKFAHPCIVVSPQTPVRGWSPQVLVALLDKIVAEHRVDQDRIYLTGLSMGGFGTWQTAAAYPDRFAAIVPICGGGNPADGPRLKTVPIWAFHGAKDDAVPLKASEVMVEAVKTAGGDAKLTVYPDAGHNVWDRAYEDPELYAWLFAQSRHR